MSIAVFGTGQDRRRPQFALAALTASNWFPDGLTQEININSYRINWEWEQCAVTQTVMRPIVRK